MTDVLVTENIVGDALDALRRDFDVVFEPDVWRQPKRLRELIVNSRALIVRNQTQVTAELLAAAPQLQIVARAGAGLDNVETSAATAAGIVVSYAPHENSVSVAELTLGLMLALARKVPHADRDTKTGGWDRRRFTGIELNGKILGIVGLGRIGRLTAARARAFGMRIVAHDTFIDPDSSIVHELEAELRALDDLLSTADFVVCHVPLTEQTHRLFNYERFCRMQPHAFFVNTSRGEVVDETGLVRALDESRIAGAAVDVRTEEPPASGSLDRFDNVILTPHVGAFTAEAQQRVVQAVCRDVRAVLDGDAAVNHFNFPKPRR